MITDTRNRGGRRRPEWLKRTGRPAGDVHGGLDARGRGIRSGRVLACCLAALLAAAATPLFSQDAEPGFGLQPGIVGPKSDPQALTRRILSTTLYLLTPGDAYELVVILDSTERYPMQLTGSYLLDVPYLGTMDVRGVYFSDLKQEIIRRIKSRVPVQYVDFLLTAPALFDVFVHGGVTNPGIATVNSLSRVTDALVLAGGPMKGASVRRVELLREGERRTLDLTRYTTEADYAQNPTLAPEDRIFVPQAATVVEIEGRVLFPGTYELLPGDTLGTLLLTAGGVLDEATVRAVRIVRLGRDGTPAVIDLALARAREASLQHLDKVSVLSALENPAIITVEGALYGRPVDPEQPVPIPQQPVMVSLPYVGPVTVLDILDQLGGPTPAAELERAHVRRENGARVDLQVAELWRSRDPRYDVQIAAGDQVVIPMKPLLVFVAGEVNDSGAFPFQRGYTVSDYLRAAGGISPLTGDPKKLYFVDDAGKRTRVSLETEVREPGTLLYAAKNTWTLTQEQLGNILVITSFVSAVITLTSQLLTFAARF